MCLASHSRNVVCFDQLQATRHMRCGPCNSPTVARGSSSLYGFFSEGRNREKRRDLFFGGKELPVDVFSVSFQFLFFGSFLFFASALETSSQHPSGSIICVDLWEGELRFKSEISM